MNSLLVTYDRWVASWDAALAAISTAARSRAVSAGEAAAHTSVVRAEREAVTRHFTVLLGHDALDENMACKDGSNGP